MKGKVKLDELDREMQTKGGEDLGISDIIAGFIQQELDQENKKKFHSTPD